MAVSSNLNAAKSALKAELAHVQAGLAYYQERVEALNDALHQLDTIDEEGDIELEKTEKKQRGRPRKAEKAGGAAQTGKKAAKRGRQPKSASRLPSTGGDFFPRLVTDRKQTAPELLQSAAAQLPFTPNAKELSQLRSRMIAALSALLKAGQISSEGERRQRTYFRA
jgi:hypothetical protein